MKRTFAVIGIAVFLTLIVGSCTKDLGTSADHSSSTINLTVRASLPDYDEVTKGSLVKNVRVSWSENDEVLVFDDKICLGMLYAALEDNNDRYAVLSGTIMSSQASKLTLVARSAGVLLATPAIGNPISSGISFNFSNQSMEKDQAPYVVFAVIDNPSRTDVSNIKTSFSFATSVINVNCTALKEGTAISQVKLTKMNTFLTITPKSDAMPDITSGTTNPDFTSSTTNTITRTGPNGGPLGTASAEGVLIFSVAVLNQDATTGRKICVSQKGWPSSSSFTASALNKGTSYNTVSQLCGPYKTIGGHSGARLWDNGPYWATSNIGANSSSDCGYFFEWGSTRAYECRDGKVYYNGNVTNNVFNWEDCVYGNPTNGFTKYNDTDNKIQLEPIDDAATIWWGSGWRMPTTDDFKSLKDKCDWRWKGTAPQGYFVTGKDDYADISIFIPAAGCGKENSHVYEGVGYYWSSSLGSTGIAIPFSLSFQSNNIYPSNATCYRYYGMNVRPISD